VGRLDSVERAGVKKPLPLFVLVFVCLTVLAIYLSNQVYRRGELAAAFVLIVAAVLFTKSLQKRNL
jgi:Flp pilus assembly protein TadB